MLRTTAVCSLLALALSTACTGRPSAPAAAPSPGPAEVWTGAVDEATFRALHDLRADSAPPRLGARVRVAPPGGRAQLDAYLSLPPRAEGPLSAVILIHEWWGLNEHIEHWADRVAALGYAVLAVDLYGGVVASTRDEAMAAMGAVDPEAARAQLTSALWYARNHPAIQAPRVATLGWCFGGKWSLETALLDPDLDGAVIYYGQVVEDVEKLRTIGAEVLGIFGTRDPSIPNEVVDRFEAALAAAGVRHRIHRYDAEHAFANPSSARYDGRSAEAAWDETRAFLAHVLTPR